MTTSDTPTSTSATTTTNAADPAFQARRFAHHAWQLFLLCFALGVMSGAVPEPWDLGVAAIQVAVAILGIVQGARALRGRRSVASGGAGPISGVVAPAVVGIALNLFMVALAGLIFVVFLRDVRVANQPWPTPLPTAPTLGPVLLTHEGRFEGLDPFAGASAFIVRHNDQNVVVTARHLLGFGFGFEPPVPVEKVDAIARDWIVKRRNGPPMTARVGPWIKALDEPEHDVIAFAAVDVDPALQVLTVRSTPAAAGEVVFIIGCPYAEKECVQNVYPALIVDRGTTRFGARLQTPVTLRGFSGAPVVDVAGRVVGVLVSGGGGGGGDKDAVAGIEDVVAVFAGDAAAAK